MYAQPLTTNQIHGLQTLAEEEASIPDEERRTLRQFARAQLGVRNKKYHDIMVKMTESIRTSRFPTQLPIRWRPTVEVGLAYIVNKLLSTNRQTKQKGKSEAWRPSYL